MAEIEPPVFVFFDDLNVFESLAQADEYYEACDLEVFRAAYDARGRVLVARPNGQGVTFTPGETQALRPDELGNRLRDYLLLLAEHRPKWLDAGWVKSAPVHELIGWCAAFYLGERSRAGRNSDSPRAGKGR